MPDTLTNLLYHCVFSTHERRPLIGAGIRDRLHAYLGGLVRGEGGVPIEIGGVEDHVHLLIRLEPRHSLATVMRIAKAKSSSWMSEMRRPERFRWQAGYAAFTVSESRVGGVRSYIRRQEEHHRRRSVGEELQELLRRHGLSSDGAARRCGKRLTGVGTPAFIPVAPDGAAHQWGIGWHRGWRPGDHGISPACSPGRGDPTAGPKGRPE